MNASHEKPVETTPVIPQAVIRSAQAVSSGRLRTRLWWLTGVCFALAMGLVVTSFRGQGKSITIHFADGHGLKVGDTLRYRGIDIGAVSSVFLADDLDGVAVEVLLTPGNEKIAVEGSQFWIQRASFRLGQVSGLDTVLGAKYLGVIPGDPANTFQQEFQGVETPLSLTVGESQGISIQFPAGEGLAVGDPVRYRGISVGEVTYIELNESAENIAVGVRLVGASREFARAGTQFWIERPRLDLTEIRGMETLLGGRYITLQPTLEESPPQTDFVGLAEPPPLTRQDGDLEIELDAPRRLGIVRGAPITYRGLEVGRVANVGLSKDGASVKVTCIVQAEYADMVRENSKWWAIGGIEIDANLRGVHVSVESLSAWIRGGIAFATPLSPGERVVTGHRFMLEPEPQEEWLNWQPRIAVGSYGQTATGIEPPTPVRVVGSWQANLLGLYRRHTAETWGLALDNGNVYVPVSFLQAAAEAGSDVAIEIAGKSIPFDAKQVRLSVPTGSFRLPNVIAVERWSAQNLAKSGDVASTMLVINPELTEPLAIDQTRVNKLDNGCLQVAPGVAIAAALGGSPVTDAATGKLIGILVNSGSAWQICPIDAK